MESNSNDIGVCHYSPQTAHIMITEFKKFMAVNAVLTISRNNDYQKIKQDTKNCYEDITNGMKWYSSSLIAPLHIDRIWKLLILHSDTYTEFCHCLWDGYIDRQEIGTHRLSEDSQNKLENWYRNIDKLKGGISSTFYFKNNLGTKVDMITQDWKYEIKVVGNVTEESKCESATSHLLSISEFHQKLDSWNDSVVDWAYENDQQQIYELADNFYNSLVTKKAWESTGSPDEFKNEKVQQFLEALYDIEFPKSLLENFKREWVLSDEFATQVFIEYLRFMTLICLYDDQISPGFWVDQLWHTHMVSTKNYRDFCLSLKSKATQDLDLKEQDLRNFIGHMPGDYSEVSNTHLEWLTDNTQKTYKQVFGQDPPLDIWKSEQTKSQSQEISTQGTKYVTVNLIGIILGRIFRENGKENEILRRAQAHLDGISSKTNKDIESAETKFVDHLHHSDSGAHFYRAAIRKYMYQALENPKTRDLVMRDLSDVKDKVNMITSKGTKEIKQFNNNWRNGYPWEAFDWYSSIGKSNNSKCSSALLHIYHIICW